MTEIVKKLSLQIDEWLKYMKPYYLSIREINKMRRGEVRKFLCIDRNVHDLAEWNGTESKDPKEFFAKNYIMVYRNGIDLKGEAKFEYPGSTEEFRPFEFDIEYKKGFWFPLHNGKLPKYHRETEIFKELADKDVIRDWKDYPKNTHIGWRGPMISWISLDYAPDIHY